MYVKGNPKSRAEIKRGLAAGKTYEVFNPAQELGFETVPMNGQVELKGPHYPEPHRWWAYGTMKDGQLVAIT